MALVVRSQIDLRGWAHFVSKGPDEAKQFLHEANIDARDLHEHMARAFPREMSPLPEPIEGKHVHLEKAGHEEKAIFKICSKLIHPTAIVLLDLNGWLYSEEHRRVLAVQVIHYGWGILNMFHDINWHA
jgi:hypothetical protein